MGSRVKKIISAEYDADVKNRLIQDDDGNNIVLRDGRSNWHDRKTYGVNFAGIFKAIASGEVKKARDNGDWKIDPETGGKMPDSPVAQKYFSKVNRMTACSCRLTFNRDVGDNIKLSDAYFCRDRLCPVCMYRLSKRIAWETNQVLDVYMERNPTMIPIMIGLTVLNPKVGELSDMLDVICSGKSGGWQLLSKWLSRRGINDYLRTVEVTFSAEKGWHPHIHCLAFVPKEYFKKGNKNYISQAELSEYWGHACKLDYNPVVDIRRVYNKYKPNERIKFDDDIKSVDLQSAVFEVSKYCVKPLRLSFSDDGGLNPKDIVRELADSLERRRLRAMGGELKRIAKELKLDNEDEKKSLLHTTDDMMTMETVMQDIYEYIFSEKDYFLTEQREIQPENSVEVNSECADRGELKCWSVSETEKQAENCAVEATRIIKTDVSIDFKNAVDSDAEKFDIIELDGA